VGVSIVSIVVISVTTTGPSCFNYS